MLNAEIKPLPFLAKKVLFFVELKKKNYFRLKQSKQE